MGNRTFWMVLGYSWCKLESIWGTRGVYIFEYFLPDVVGPVRRYYCNHLSLKTDIALDAVVVHAN